MSSQEAALPELSGQTAPVPATSETLAPSSPAVKPADSDPVVPETSPISPPPPPNPRLVALHTKKTTLEQTLAELEQQRSTLIAQAKLPSGLPFPAGLSDEERSKQALASANAVVKEHIALLHSYNEVKDIGLGLMGLIADKRGVRIAPVMEEFGMTDKD